MQQLKLKNDRLINDAVFKSYVNVYIHCENNSIVEGHMVILAQASPFLHRFFQSRKNLMVADMFFTTVKQSIVEDALKLIYGKIVKVNQQELKRLSSFLNMLQIEFELVTSSIESNSSLDKKLPSTFASPSSDHLAANKNTETKEPHYAPHDMNQGDDATPNSPIHKSAADIDIDFQSWTVTSESEARVSKIDHTVFKFETSKRLHYKCIRCNKMSDAFRNAEKHFLNEHQDFTHVKEMLLKVDQERKSHVQKRILMEHIIEKNGDKTLVQHELT